MTGQFQRPFSEQFQHVLVVSGDDRVRRLLNTPVGKVLPESQVDLVDPQDGAISFMDGVDLIVLGLSQEWPGARAWLAELPSEDLPPIISIDFSATINAAVAMMRMGVADYIDSSELDERRLIDALLQLTGGIRPADSPVDADRTDVSPYLHVGEQMVNEGVSDETEVIQEIADVSPITDMASDQTEVISHVSAEDSDQTEVIPQIADVSPAADMASDQTEVISHVSAADSDQTEVIPQIADVSPAADMASDQTEVISHVSAAESDQTEVISHVPTEAPGEADASDVSAGDAKETTSVFQQIIANMEEPGEEMQATVQLSNEALLKLQQQHRSELGGGAASETPASEAPGVVVDDEIEIGPHTEVASHVNGRPKIGQFEIDDSFLQDDDSGETKKEGPFSGAWLRMPDSIGDRAWPFSAQDMEDGTAMLGGYRVLEFLGVGGMASVFKAQRISDDKLFAIKLLDPTMADDNVRERFVREFNILQTIHHKHVVEMEEQVDEGEWIYTVMEYLPGGDLKSRIRRRLKREEAVRYASQIAAALSAAHKLGVLHRDLKPANVLFRSDGSLALVDFGVAKATLGDDEALTKEGQMVGTPYYASPEQATGAVVDRRSDLYALGVIMFEMLEGRRPFVGDTSLQVLMAHVKDPVPLLSHDWDILNDVLSQLLAKEPVDRLPDGQAVVRALNEASPGDVPAYLLEDE